MSTPMPNAAELAELQHTLIRHGFVRCDIAACNCGGWHARYGLRQRFDEIVQALSDAGHPLTNDNGNLALNALGELVAERDAQAARLAELDAFDVRKILVDVVPGPDGMGHEVYAKSVDAVVRLLTELGEKAEELDSLRSFKAALAQQVPEPQQPVNAQMLDALKLAVRQNEHDMLMTGEELRQCEAAITAAETAQAGSAQQVPAVPGWRLVPVEPTHAMVSAMACSKAKDAEGEFPALLDLIDYSGENKTHTVLIAAFRAALAAAPLPTPTPEPAQMTACPHDVPHRWACEICDSATPEKPA